MGVGICRPSIHSVRFILKKTVVSLRSQVHHTPHHTDCLDVDTFLRHDNVHDFVEAEMPYPKWGDEKRTFENKVNVKDKINTKERSIGGHRESAFAILPASPSIDDNDDRGQQQQ